MLYPNLQQQLPFNKWKQQATAGIYLGLLPLHNQNIALVLNRETGHVSPQFHVKFNKHFSMVKSDNTPSQ